MQNEKISNWDLVLKLLNDNGVEIHVNRCMDDSKNDLYLLHKEMQFQYGDFYLPSTSFNQHRPLQDYVNKMPVSRFKDFYEELCKEIKKIKDIDEWYQKLIEKYKMDMKNEKI